MLYIFRNDMYGHLGGTAPIGVGYYFHCILPPLILVAIFIMPLVGAILIAPTFKGAVGKVLYSILFVFILTGVTIFLYGVTVGIP